MKTTLFYLFLLSTITFYSQTQIGDDIDGEGADSNSGWSVSLSSDGSIVAIGAPYNSGNGMFSGQVRIYENNSGAWTQIGADIDGEAIGDNSGYSVSLSSDGSVVAIGAYRNDGNGEDSGQVRVYKNNAGVWTQIGADIDGEAAFDLSGTSVSLSSDGSVLAIGSPGNDGNGEVSGLVRVYKNNAGVWTQIGVDIDGEAIGDGSGTSVSLSFDGNILAIGAPGNTQNGQHSGQVRVYKNNSGVWGQIGNDIEGEGGDELGESVSLSSDGSIVATGAPLNGTNGENSGNVRVFKNDSGVWNQIGADINGETAWDFSGLRVSLSSDGNIVAIGSPGSDGNGDDSGQVRIYQNNSSVWTQRGTDIDGESMFNNSGMAVISLDFSLVLIWPNTN